MRSEVYGKDVLECRRIIVDCVPNDQPGNTYLGFEFIVKEDEVEEMKEFIATKLNELEIPVEEIWDTYHILESGESFLTKDAIEECIVSNSDYLKSKVPAKHL